jgi:hypothetical protein
VSDEGAGNELIGTGDVNQAISCDCIPVRISAAGGEDPPKRSMTLMEMDDGASSDDAGGIALSSDDIGGIAQFSKPC